MVNQGLQPQHLPGPPLTGLHKTPRRHWREASEIPATLPQVLSPGPPMLSDFRPPGASLEYPALQRHLVLFASPCAILLLPTAQFTNTYLRCSNGQGHSQSHCQYTDSCPHPQPSNKHWGGFGRVTFHTKKKQIKFLPYQVRLPHQIPSVHLSMEA